MDIPEEVDLRKHEESQQEVNSSSENVKNEIKSTCLIVLGMAGSGKTTFVQKLAQHQYENESPAYLINLDPACYNMPYPANIDIRDTINYKKVMKEYELGPNGAILTSLNLFATKIDQLVSIIGQKQDIYKQIILDTPGQIEVFNWSASGVVITETMASQLPTAIIYVLDTVRNRNPATFMSNMLYACSILYKTKLPMILVLNKTDLQSADFLVQWMTDFDSFISSLEDEKGYISNLTRSLALALDNFYSELKTVAVSSLSGLGMDEFLEAVENAHREYYDIYVKERNASNDFVKETAMRLSDLKMNVDTIPEETLEEEED